MNPEILLVRHGDEYRILHGHLRLASVMRGSSEAIVEASGEGKVKVVKTPCGFVIGEDNRRLAMLANNA